MSVRSNTPWFLFGHSLLIKVKWKKLTLIRYEKPPRAETDGNNKSGASPFRVDFNRNRYTYATDNRVKTDINAVISALNLSNNIVFCYAITENLIFSMRVNAMESDRLPFDGR